MSLNERSSSRVNSPRSLRARIVKPFDQDPLSRLEQLTDRDRIRRKGSLRPTAEGDTDGMTPDAKALFNFSFKAERSKNKLPEEIIPPVSRGIFILTMIGTLLCIVLMNAFTGAILRKYTPNVGYQRVREKWNRLLHLSKPVDWLVLGDSTCDVGVQPAILEERLGGKALNLCTNGNLLVLNDVWMLEEYIKRQGIPKGVIIMHAFDVLPRKLSMSFLSQIPLEQGFWKKYDPKVTLSKHQSLDYFLDRFVPLYSQNKSIGDLFESVFFRSQKKRIKFENGHMLILQGNPDELKRDLLKQIQFVENNSFQVSLPNENALKQLAVLTNKYHFDIFLVNSPIYVKLYENPQFLKYYAQVQDYFKNYSQQSDRIYRLLQEPQTFSAAQMENTDHIVGEEAVSLLTTRIAREISLIKDKIKVAAAH